MNIHHNSIKTEIKDNKLNTEFQLSLKMSPKRYFKCEKCNHIPQLIYDNQKVEIQCQCSPKKYKELSIQDFISKSHIINENKCFFNHESKSGIGYCQQCDCYYCDKCLEFHKKITNNLNHKFTIFNYAETTKICQNNKCKNKVSYYCRECLKYFCENCINISHSKHMCSSINAQKKYQIFNDSKERIKKAKELLIKIKLFKDNLIEKININYDYYNSSMNSLFNYMNIIFDTFMYINNDYYDYNIIHNLEITIPYLEYSENFDSENISNESIDAYFKTCKYVSKYKTLDIFNNGEKYDGEVVNGYNHGFGTYYWRDGSMYEGNWDKGNKDGYGKEVFKNGDIYEGNHRNNKRDGFGKFYYKSDGFIFQGYWKNQLKEGLGIMYNKQYEIEFQGEWKNNKPVIIQSIQ